MATTTQVTLALNEVSGRIVNARKRMINAKTVFDIEVGVLSNLVTQYNDVITTIQAFGTVNSWEVSRKEELAKITVEFQALLADAQVAITDLANRTEF